MQYYFANGYQNRKKPSTIHINFSLIYLKIHFLGNGSFRSSNLIFMSKVLSANFRNQKFTIKNPCHFLNNNTYMFRRNK